MTPKLVEEEVKKKILYALAFEVRWPVSIACHFSSQAIPRRLYDTHFESGPTTKAILVGQNGQHLMSGAVAVSVVSDEVYSCVKILH